MAQVAERNINIIMLLNVNFLFFFYLLREYSNPVLVPILDTGIVSVTIPDTGIISGIGIGTET